MHHSGKILIVWLAGFLLAGIAHGQGEVKIDLREFGVRSVYRQGDLVGMRLQVVNLGQEPVNADVVWETEEAMGDIVELTRSNVVLGPGSPTSVWLYNKLAPTADNNTIWTVRVYVNDDGDRGRELGVARISPLNALSPATMVPHSVGLIGVIGGGGTLAIDDYNVTATQQRDAPLTGHEFTQIVNGIAEADLPDRWEGLDQFETLIWTDAQPGAVGLSQGNALRDWIERGGHFVIVLSTARNDWNIGTSSNNQLHDLLPQELPLVTSMRLTDLLPVISKRAPRAFPRDPTKNIEVSARLFERVPPRYVPTVVLPGGKPIVIDRLFGHGRITLVGFEVQSGQLAMSALRITDGGGEILEADAFWNRILGRRVDTLIRKQIAQLEEDSKITSASTFRTPTNFGSGNLIIEMIKLSSQAFAGIGLAVLLFIAYWVLAGPVGFAFLKATKRVKHSWLAFAATSALFTFLAWGGVQLFSLRDIQVRHLSVVDYVALPPDQVRADDRQYHRAVSWFTVFLPGYGDRRLSLDSEDDERNVLFAYAAPNVEQTQFKNVDRYSIDVNSPADFSVPARSTTKEMYARWIGPVSEPWGGLFTVTSPIEVSAAAGSVMKGTIKANFSGTLSDVKVYVIQPRLTSRVTYTDDVGANPELTDRFQPFTPYAGQVFGLGQVASGAILDLSTTPAGTILSMSFDRVTDAAESRASNRMSTSVSADEARGHLEMLSFYHMIKPPDFFQRNNQQERDFIFNRHVGREIDLSKWMVRPCIVITGFMDNDEIPVPFRVDGKVTVSSGTTMYRWIYPLPVKPEDIVVPEK